MREGLELGSRHEVKVDAVTSEGAGVGRLRDGRVVFTHRTAPGDEALVEITNVRPRWARATLVELRGHGSERRKPMCPHYHWCGGCTMQHLEYSAQLSWKARFVTDALARIGGSSPPEATVHPSPRETRYRNRVTFTAVRLGGGRIKAGFHRLDAPGRIEDVDGRCVLPEPVISEVWDQLRARWGDQGERLPNGRRLRLTLRSVGEREVLMFVEGGGGGGDAEALISEIPELRSIWHRREGSQDEPRLLAGSQQLAESWHGAVVTVQPAGFLQVNRMAAEQLHAHVLTQCVPAGGKRVIDAYCGAGSVGRHLAREGAIVVGIDADPEAGRMLHRDGVEGFQLLVGTVEDLISGLLPAEIVVLNPPRSGVRPRVIEALLRNPPERILYVSCDPATLARDVGRLGASYQISRLHVFDLFPQTSRVETALTLDRVETQLGESDFVDFGAQRIEESPGEYPERIGGPAGADRGSFATETRIELE